MLVERSAHLEHLAELVGAAGAGAGGCVVLEAAAGLGKTALLAELHTRAERAGLTTLAATGVELERQYAFGVARQLLAPFWLAAGAGTRRALLDGAAELAAPLLDGGTDPDQRGDSVLYGAYWLVAGIADRTPLLITIDDAQWADDPSLDLIDYLARRVHDIPALMVIARRPQARRSARADRPAAGVLQLDPLSVDAVELLTGAAPLGGEPDRVFAAAVHAATGGNPLYVRAVVDEIGNRGLPAAADSVAAVAGDGPEPVVRSVGRRLSALTPAEAAFAEALAILGDGSALTTTASLAGVDADHAALSADALAREGILASGPMLAFAHPVVRGAVLGRIGAHDQAARHAEAARLLADAGADPERVAAHILIAPPGTLLDAVATLQQAAGAALARGAPTVAATFLARAMDEPLCPDDRFHVAFALAAARARNADPACLEAFATAHEATDDPQRRCEVTLARALVLYRGGAAREAAAAIDAELLEPGLSPEMIGRLRAELLTLADLDLAVRPVLSDRLAGIAHALGTDDGPYGPLLLTHRAVEGLLAYEDARVTGDIAERALAACVSAASGRDGARPVREDVVALLNFVLDACERFDVIRPLGMAALEQAAQLGDLGAYSAIGTTYAFSRLRCGDLADADAIVRSLLQNGGELSGVPEAFVCWMSQTVLQEIERDRTPAAELRAHGMDPDRLDLEATAQRASLKILRGHLRVAAGDLEAGLASLVDGGESMAAMGYEGGSYHWRSGAALALHGLGRVDEARAQAQIELRAHERWGAPRALGVSQRAAALVAPSNEGRVAGLQEAVATLERSQAPLELARALGDLGAALRRLNRRADAREPLRRAIEIADACGARTRVAALARVELTAAGGRAPRPARTGPAALTPSERRVAGMAAEGRSNPQIAQALFISRRTVETHLASAYAKLGIAGRGELGQALESQ